MNEQRKCFHYTNLRPPWVANSIGLGARQCDLTVGCVRFGANGRNLDKSDLHPGLDVLQRHRCVAEHDYERWNEQLDVERRFGWRSSSGGSSSGGAGAGGPTSIPNAPCGDGFPMDAWGDCN